MTTYIVTLTAPDYRPRSFTDKYAAWQYMDEMQTATGQAGRLTWEMP